MFDSVGTPWTVAHQALLSVGFPRQEYWSGLPFPSPEDLPDPEIEPLSPALTGGFFTTESPGKPCLCCIYLTYYTPIKLAIFFSLGLRFNATSQKGQASLVAQKIKNLPAMRQISVQSLGQKDPLKKEMVIHYSILAWENPTDKGTWWVVVHGVAKSQI